MVSLNGRYRLYLDETGTHQLPRHQLDQDRYLGLLGVIISRETYYAKFCTGLHVVKRRTFGFDPDTPIVLHRECIMKRRGAFSVLNDEAVRRKFNADLVGLYGTQDYTLICVVLDKSIHMRRYGKRAYGPYDYCFELLAERFCYFLNRHSATGDMIAESRGKREDAELMKAWEKFHAQGNQLTDAGSVRRCLAPDALMFRQKYQNVPGLQLADLLAYDATREVLVENGCKRDETSGMYPHIKMAIASKWDRCQKSGKVIGYGRVLKK